MLLLDEPTNHLDIESIQWLENFLATKANAVVLVSHDRAFINNVTNRTLEISCGRVFDYKVKYDEYVRLRAERREQQLRAYENQQKEIADIKEDVYKRQAQKRLALSEKNMEKAEENLRYADKGFKEGVVPVTNVMEAQTAWLSAQSDRIDAQIDLKLAQTYLQKAMGTLGPGL